MSLQQAWYSGARWPRLLLPLSLLYGAVIAMRCLAYRRGWLRTHQVGIPVIVVGNITVGGSGKTPLVAGITQRLRDSGWQPGIISRGYGGRAKQWPQTVTAHSDPAEVGDEPVLLAQDTGCPVVVAPDRVAAARVLVEQGVDIIVADDGLQHYALARDIEIAVRDGERGYGNGFLLPAGPLREPMHRLQTADLEWVNAVGGDFTLEPGDALPLSAAGLTRPLASFAGTPVHAVAGIGNPERFFNMLRGAGLQIIEHVFTDHYKYNLQDIVYNDKYTVLMTAKDAVKCAGFAQPEHWYVPVSARLTAQAGQHLDRLMQNIIPQARQ